MFESDRARVLLRSGAALVADLSGSARLAVGGFVAGGLATLDAFAAGGHDVLASTLRPVARRTVGRPRRSPGREPDPERGMTVVDAAYSRCEEITRQEAKNFSYGIRLLPTDKRRAMSAIYALARRHRRHRRRRRPARREARRARRGPGAHRRHPAVDAAAGRGDPDPVYARSPTRPPRFAIPLDAFDDLVDGC